MDLEQWTVGGRGFGLVLVWLLMAGEIYTTFTFLGASGWAYSRGGPVLYILGYLPLMYVISFYILPPIWDAGRKHGLQTQADFFEVRYGSLFLAAFVALVGVVCLIPYLQMQITGLGLIVEVASYGAIGHTPAMIVAFALVAAFVFVSGVRGVAWASIVKDHPLVSASGDHRLAGAVTLAVFVSAIDITLWLVIARGCRRGRNGARVTGTVLFALHTLGVLSVVVSSQAGLGLAKVLTLIGWLIGCGAVVFLWQRPSSVFFSAKASPNR